MVVGQSIARRCAAARVGGRLRIGTSDWAVVGVVNDGESAANSELFADVDDIAGDFNRRNQFTSVLVRATDERTVLSLINSLNGDRRLNVSAQTEAGYYDRQRTSGIPMEQLGILVSLMMSVGSSFAAMNTMYAAVSHRAREIGTLHVLGFSRRSILSSFLLESLILATAGGLSGCLAALPLNFVTTAIGNFTTMSETAFHLRVGIPCIMAGIVFSLVIGLAGGLLPARMAARKDILSALREM
jgi:putative ABC transport system permease protein